MKWYYLIIVFYVLTGCNTFNKVKDQLSGSSPYERYRESLTKAGLKNTALAQTWELAGSKVFRDSIFLTLPFTETMYFSSASPDARSYRFQAKEGQVLIVKGTLKSRPESKVFIDLFVNTGGKWKMVAYSDSSYTINYEFKKDADCLLRVQPELLIDVFLTIKVTSTPVLINPVTGASNKSIGSFYGAQRDGGSRKHEGVDIFAPRGTPVVAPTDGFISNVANNKLGGKIIWMYDNKRGHTYYFAHLDTQLVSVGKVSQGDTLGTVGNTGNAGSTPAHLHFGIYQRGSKDPLHYIKLMEGTLKEVEDDTSIKYQAYKIKVKSTPLYKGPGTTYPAFQQLNSGNYVKVLGFNHQWYRVSLSGGKEGYVARKAITLAKDGKTIFLAKQTMLLNAASDSSFPIKELNTQERVEVLAESDGFKYVKDQSGKYGWIML